MYIGAVCISRRWLYPTLISLTRLTCLWQRERSVGDIMGTQPMDHQLNENKQSYNLVHLCVFTIERSITIHSYLCVIIENSYLNPYMHFGSCHQEFSEHLEPNHHLMFLKS